MLAMEYAETSQEKLPSRLPVLSELGIVLCIGMRASRVAHCLCLFRILSLDRCLLVAGRNCRCTGATAAFRMASTKEVDGSAAATMLLATLTAAAASFRPSSAGSTLRKQLHMRHKDGIAVGSLCIPVICATILVGDPNNGALDVDVSR